MTDLGLLAVQFVGTFVVAFFCCRNSYKRGRAAGYETGYAIGKLDGTTRSPTTPEAP